jgi:hypothetical protein
MESIMRDSLVTEYKQEWEFHNYIYGMKVIRFTKQKYCFKIDIYSKEKDKSGYFEHSFFYLPFWDSYKMHKEIEEFSLTYTENGILAKELIYILMNFYKQCEVRFIGV